MGKNCIKKLATIALLISLSFSALPVSAEELNLFEPDSTVSPTEEINEFDQLTEGSYDPSASYGVNELFPFGENIELLDDDTFDGIPSTEDNTEENGLFSSWISSLTDLFSSDEEECEPSSSADTEVPDEKECIYKADNAADFAAAVQVLDDSEGKRLIVLSNEDISEYCNNLSGVYYDGTYILSFDSFSEKNEVCESLSQVFGSDNVYPDFSMSVDVIDEFPSVPKPEEPVFESFESLEPAYSDGLENLSFSDTLEFLFNNESTEETSSVGWNPFAKDGNRSDPVQEIENSIDSANLSSAENGLTLSGKAASEGTKLVALIDTGCNDLADTCVNLTSDSDTDLNGHGTMMAKYVLYEAGPDIRLLSIKALGDDGKGNVSNIYAAVKYAIEAGADVINMSFSSRDAEDAEAFKEIVSSAVSAGIIVVASAGNDGMNAVNYIPANIDGVITVGSCDSEGNIRDFSNYGSCVEYLVSSDSTSEAAARVTGMIASGKTDLSEDEAHAIGLFINSEAENDDPLTLIKKSEFEINEDNNENVDYFLLQILDPGPGYLTLQNPWNGRINIENLTTGNNNILNPSGNLEYINVSEGDEVKISQADPDAFRSWNIYRLFNGTDLKVAISKMPPMSAFTEDEAGTIAGDYFFHEFLNTNIIVSLPDGSFDTSNITTVGYSFFSMFHEGNDTLTELPEGSFNISNITTAGNNFFYAFNEGGTLQSLPEGSFDTNGLITVGDNAFAYFNGEPTGASTVLHSSLPALPDGSFCFSSLTSAGAEFCAYFNSYGSIQSLPEDSFQFSNLNSVDSGFFKGFNYSGGILYLPENSFDTSCITTVGEQFFESFNEVGKISFLPDGSFDTTNITAIANAPFTNFNKTGKLQKSEENYNPNFINPSVNSRNVGAYYHHFNGTSYVQLTGNISPGNPFYYKTGTIADYLDSVQFNITFDANSGMGEMPPQQYYAGMEQSLSECLFTREGCDFTGWNTKADGSGTSYEDKQSLTFADKPSEDIVLYAQWEAKIKILFDANEGTGSMEALDYFPDMIQYLPENAFTKEDYKFTGWNTEADGTGDISFDDKALLEFAGMPSDDVTLYAQWEYCIHYIDIQADAAGTLTVSNQWRNPLYIQNITKNGTKNTINASASSSISTSGVTVSTGDVIRVSEKTVGAFRVWNNLSSAGTNYSAPFVKGVSAHIVYMPEMNCFTTDEEGTIAGDRFFAYFNRTGSTITSYPDGSFDLSSITTIGTDFFRGFNYQNTSLAALPDNSFNTQNITAISTTVNANCFYQFNREATLLTELPAGSFKLGYIPDVGDGFFREFNYKGSLTSLPEGSFTTENIETAGDYFFDNFNFTGHITSLPEGSFNLNGLTSANGVSMFNSFNAYGYMTSIPENSFSPVNLREVGDSCFYQFNLKGSLSSLPKNTFNFSSLETVGKYFCYSFNNAGSISSMADNTFNIRNVKQVGNEFFRAFNAYGGQLTSLSRGSFRTENIETVGLAFFKEFNYKGNLTSLPAGSFRLSNNLTIARSSFFEKFNYEGKITSLPANSFNTDNIVSVFNENNSTGNNFFYYFNHTGDISSLPANSFNTSNITRPGTYFLSYFNSKGKIPKSTTSYNPAFINAYSSNINAFYYDSGTNKTESVANKKPLYYLTDAPVSIVTLTYKYPVSGSYQGALPETQSVTPSTDVTLATNTVINNTSIAQPDPVSILYDHNYQGSAITTDTAERVRTMKADGWSLSEAGNRKDYENRQIVTIVADTELYANFKEKVSVHSIILETPTRPHYTFGGWYKEADCVNFIGNAGASYTPESTSTVTLYAKWGAKETASLTYGKGISDTGSLPEQQTVDVGERVTIGKNETIKNRTVASDGIVTTFEVNGGTECPETVSSIYNNYTAAGWSKNSDGSTKDYDDEEKITLSSDLKLYPHFNISEEIESIILPSPTKDGCSFAGWYLQSDFATNSYVAEGGARYYPDHDTILYARWIRESLTISFDNNGGTGEMPDLTYSVNESKPLTPNIFTRQGYSFLCWNTAKEGDGTTYIDKQVLSFSDVSNDIVLYAQWKPDINTPYSVVHQQETLVSGEYRTVTTMYYRGTTDSYVTPEVQTYAGFEAPEPQTVKIDATGSTKVVYKYKRLSYTLGLNKGNGIVNVSGAGTYKFEAPINISASLVEGYDFISWTDGENNVVSTNNVYSFTMPAKDIAYTANADVIVNVNIPSSITFIMKADGTTAPVTYTIQNNTVPRGVSLGINPVLNSAYGDLEMNVYEQSGVDKGSLVGWGSANPVTDSGSNPSVLAKKGEDTSSKTYILELSDIAPDNTGSLIPELANKKQKSVGMIKYDIALTD